MARLTREAQRIQAHIEGAEIALDQTAIQIGVANENLHLSVPEQIELDGPYLRWRGEMMDAPGSVPRTLMEFIRLPDASDEQILAFAKTFGVLGVFPWFL